MAQYNERDWNQTKDTEQLTFTAGQDLPYREYVREDPIGSHIVISSTQALAIGYVLSPKGVLAGEKVDVHMLRALGSLPPGGGGGGGSNITGVNYSQAVGTLDIDTDQPATFSTSIPNIYNSDGTLTSARTVNFGGNNMAFVAAGPERFYLFNHFFRQDVNGVELGYLTSIAGTASNVFLDFRAESNAIQPDWSARIIRDAGQNAGFYIANKGTGPLNFTTGGGSAANLDGVTRQLQLVAYGSGTFLNTPAYNLGVDPSGNVIEVPASTGGGSNVIDFQYDVTTETATITTDLPASFQATWPIKIQNIIHVSKNGNDSAAAVTVTAPYSLQVPFLTIEAAYAASGGDDIIVVWPGKYVLSTGMTIDFTKAAKFHFMPGATISTQNAVAFNITQPGHLRVTGSALWQVHNYVFQNTSGDVAEVTLEADYAFNDNLVSYQYFADISNMKVDIRLNELLNLGFYAREWKAGFIGIDRWDTTTQNLLYCSNPSSFLSSYGNANLYIGGRTTKKGVIRRIDPTLTNTGIFFEADRYKYWQNTLELNFDVYWQDGYFIIHGNGEIVFNGNMYHKKSNSLGNELPWYISNSPIESGVDEKPLFRHNGNSINVKFKPNAESDWFLNNTAYFFQAGGRYYLNGNYQVLGATDNGVAGDFPVISIQDDSSGYDIHVFINGVLKTGAPSDATIVTDANVGPIKVNNLGFGNIFLNFMDTMLVCGGDEKLVGPIWTSSLTSAVPLRVNHSLTMSNPVGILEFPNAYSFDRISVDTQINYEIEGWGQ